MPDNFDPYQQWLGIAPHEQPADYYRLLGLAQFENNQGAIEKAADQRASHIQMFASGGTERTAKTILNELAAARLCLLDPQAKQQYDGALKTLIATSGGGSHRPPPPVSPAPQGGVPADGSQVDASLSASSPDAMDEEGPLPIYLQTWFPLSLVGVVLLLAIVLGVVWYTRSGPAEPPPVAAADPPETPPVPPPVVEEFQQAAVGQDSAGVVTLTPSQAKLGGGATLTSSGGDLVIGNWSSLDGSATWQVRIGEGVFHTVKLLYAAQDRGKYLLEVNDTKKTRSIRPSDPGETSIDEFLIRLPAGREYTLTIRASELQGAELMELKSIQLIKSNRH